jgi:GT2 family glycosyltransferase
MRKDANSMNLAVGVLHYRNPQGLGTTMESVRAQTRQPEHLLIVDHASQDGSLEQVKRDYPDVPVVEIATNRGPVAGVNHVLRELLARPVEAVLVLTDDVRLEPDVLEQLVQRLEEKPSLGALCPLNVYSDPTGRTMIHYGGYLDPRTWHTTFTGEPGDVADWTGRPPHSVDWIEAAAEMFRAEAARQAGPLTEAFYHRDGETELTIKMKALGWELECVPSAVAYTHFGRDSTYLNTRNHLHIIRKNAPKRFLVREMARVSYLVARDILSPRRRPDRDTWFRLRGLVDFATGRWGPPPEHVTRRA